MSYRNSPFHYVCIFVNESEKFFCFFDRAPFTIRTLTRSYTFSTPSRVIKMYIIWRSIKSKCPLTSGVYIFCAQEENGNKFARTLERIKRKRERRTRACKVFPLSDDDVGENAVSIFLFSFLLQLLLRVACWCGATTTKKRSKKLSGKVANVRIRNKSRKCGKEEYDYINT